MSLFAVFAVLSIVLFVNLNLYEIDEKKILFRTMRQSGFDMYSLAVYTLVVDMIILAAAFMLFLGVSLPLLAHFQVGIFGGIKYFNYVITWWSPLIALVAMVVLAMLSYLVTLPKFGKEMVVCSKL